MQEAPVLGARKRRIAPRVRVAKLDRRARWMSFRSARLVAVALCGLWLLGGPRLATAQPVTPSAGPARVAPDSPRQTLSEFLESCRRGRYDEAARYLELSPENVARGPELARRLKAVLDRHVWLELSSLSSLSTGDEEDDLPRDIDEVAQVPGRLSEVREPVRLMRVAGDEAGWRFTAATVRRIDGWYERLPHGWLIEHLPEVLTQPGPLNLLWWQWLALPVLLLIAVVAGRLLAELTRRVLGRMVKRSASTWDDKMLSRLSGPLTLGWTLVAQRTILPWLSLYQPAEELSHRWLRGGFFVVFFWALSRMVDVMCQLIAESAWAQTHPASRSLLPLGMRVGKVVILVIATVALLSEFGYPVASLLAGLGIGGLALALAAQKTVENLFGAFSIGADQPFREGDFVRVEDFVGTVEAIGLRSTRFRTLDRTMISIPNGKLADMRLESFATRDRIRLACTLGLVYDTSATQMREVMVGIERALREHPKIWPTAVVVRFKELGASSLDIEVMAWFQTPDWSEFQLIRQEMLLVFMEIVAKAGTSFAFPTQTLHVIPEEGEIEESSVVGQGSSAGAP